MPKLLWILIPVCLFAQQQSLTNARIADLAQAGVSESELLRIVASAPAIDFDLQPASTAALMKAGVSENLIKAMAARELAPAPLVSIAPVIAPTPKHRHVLRNVIIFSAIGSATGISVYFAGARHSSGGCCQNAPF